jgi:hypothetical protein
VAPTSKSALTRLCWPCATETHADAANPCPDSTHPAPHTREGILEVKGIWQPALPAHAQLCSTLRFIFDATGEIASARHQDFCWAVNFLARRLSALEDREVTLHEADNTNGDLEFATFVSAFPRGKEIVGACNGV